MQTPHWTHQRHSQTPCKPARLQTQGQLFSRGAQFAASGLTCTTTGAPPYTTTARSPVCHMNFRASSCIWQDSSRVGLSTRACGKAFRLRGAGPWLLHNRQAWG